MKNKKIVSIEDRIPKLKQQRKKKANRRLIFYLSIFFLLISIVVYLQSPLSNIKTIEVNGNQFVTDEQIMEESDIKPRTNIWTINKKHILDAINNHPAIKSATVARKLPRTIEITVEEYKRVGYVVIENEQFPILSNGETLPAQKSIGDAPLLIGFDEESYLKRMTNELNQLPKTILNLISEIHWTPKEGNNHKLLLYMNDGFLVDGTIRDFANKMQVYPSIVSQLDPDSKGIVHIGVGAYFEDFNEKKKKKED